MRVFFHGSVDLSDPLEKFLSFACSTFYCKCVRQFGIHTGLVLVLTHTCRDMVSSWSRDTLNPWVHFSQLLLHKVLSCHVIKSLFECPCVPFSSVFHGNVNIVLNSSFRGLQLVYTSVLRIYKGLFTFHLVLSSVLNGMQHSRLSNKTNQHNYITISPCQSHTYCVLLCVYDQWNLHEKLPK